MKAENLITIAAVLVVGATLAGNPAYSAQPIEIPRPVAKSGTQVASPPQVRRRAFRQRQHRGYRIRMRRSFSGGGHRAADPQPIPIPRVKRAKRRYWAR